MQNNILVNINVATSDRFDLPSANMGNTGRSLLLIYYYYASYTLDYLYNHVVNMLICAAVLKTYFLAVLKSGNNFFKIDVVVCFCLFSAAAILDLADGAFLSRPITGLW